MKGLKIILWICAICCLLGFVFAALPWRAITAFFDWFEVQPPTAEPITVFMFRLCSAMGGMIAVDGSRWSGAYFGRRDHENQCVLG